MTKSEVLNQLKALGTEQNRKVYARHGVKGETFGVSCANLGKLKKRIKVDHGLALELWATGNHDARVLATMIADPARMTARLLDAWVKELDDYVLTDAFSGLAAKSPAALKRMERWTAATGEWVAGAGWGVLAHRALNDDDLSDAYLEKTIEAIETGIHAGKNRVRHAMNQALIAIGIRNPRLEKKAVAAAKRIGKVEVDHGQTSCKTPDAVATIKKTLEYRRKKRAGKAYGVDPHP